MNLNYKKVKLVSCNFILLLIVGCQSKIIIKDKDVVSIRIEKKNIFYLNQDFKIHVIVKNESAFPIAFCDPSSNTHGGAIYILDKNHKRIESNTLYIYDLTPDFPIITLEPGQEYKFFISFKWKKMSNKDLNNNRYWGGNFINSLDFWYKIKKTGKYYLYFRFSSDYERKSYKKISRKYRILKGEYTSKKIPIFIK